MQKEEAIKAVSAAQENLFNARAVRDVAAYLAEDRNFEEYARLLGSSKESICETVLKVAESLDDSATEALDVVQSYFEAPAVA